MIKKILYIITAAFLAGCAGSGTGYEFEALYDGLPFEMRRVEKPSIPSREFLLTDFGATGDGVTINTKAFAQAIAAIEKTGGGRLCVPAGIWTTGPITLCSNMDLHLEDGAIILFSPDFDLYPLVNTYFEGWQTMRCQSPVNARGAHDVSITGSGIIDGSGDAWRPVKKSKLSPAEWKQLVTSGGVLSDDDSVWYPSEKSKMGVEISDMNVPRDLSSPEQWEAVKDFLRPVMISFVECERVMLEGVTFRNSPAWNIHPMLCRDLIIKNILVQNPWYAQNGDAVDVESCDGVIISGSTFDAGDDGICIKSGKDKEGRERGAPAQNIIVDNCTVLHGHGGFVVGSEMSGGVRNISVSNCRFLGTDVGLRFKSQRGRGGVVENIFIRDVYMTNIPAEPLLFDLFYGGKSAVESLADGDEIAAEDAPAMPVDETTPVFRNIHISRVVCNDSRRAMFFNGLPEMNISGVTVEDCTIGAMLGAEIRESDSVVLRNVTINPRAGAALTINNAKNVAVDNFRSQVQNGPAFAVSGSRNKDIVVTASSITAGNSGIQPAAAGEVRIE